jgi:hypothetical protein
MISQGQLFTPTPMDVARQRGERGMEQAADHADRVHRDWQGKALAKCLSHIQTLPRDHKFIIEDVRLAVAGDLPEPPDQRAWGAVTQTAIRRLYIVKTGEYAPAKSSNASPKPLYRRGGAV